MADQPQLKEAYRGIEASLEEMRRYRAGLAARLEHRHPHRPRWRFLWLAVPLAAVLVLALLPRRKAPEFNQHRPVEVFAMIESNRQPQRLLADAEKVHRQGNREERLNATLVLCVMRPAAAGVYLAAEGLRLDTRPAFRAFYLEYLLDNAEDYDINRDALENLMDDESDRLCLALFEDLLKFT